MRTQRNITQKLKKPYCDEDIANECVTIMKNLKSFSENDTEKKMGMIIIQMK